MEKNKNVFDWDTMIPWFKKFPFKPDEEQRPCVIPKETFIISNEGTGRPDGHAPSPIYIVASTQKLGFVCVMKVAPGDYFESDNHPNDETYYQVKGTLHLANSHTGQVVVLEPGEALFIPAYEFHVGFNLGNEETITLACVPGEFHTPEMKADPVFEHHFQSGHEIFSDSEIKEHPGHPSKLRNLCRWPIYKNASLPAATNKDNIKIPRENWLHYMTGSERAPVRTSFYYSSPVLAAGTVLIPSGRISSKQKFNGETVLYALRKPIIINLPQPSVKDVSQFTNNTALHINEGDGVFIPPNTEFNYQNFSGDPVEVFFWITPWEGASWFKN